MHDFRLFAIHDATGYHKARKTLSQQYNFGTRETNFLVWNVNRRSDRAFTLRHPSTKTGRCTTAPWMYSSIRPGYVALTFP